MAHTSNPSNLVPIIDGGHIGIYSTLSDVATIPDYSTIIEVKSGGTTVLKAQLGRDADAFGQWQLRGRILRTDGTVFDDTNTLSNPPWQIWVGFQNNVMTGEPAINWNANNAFFAYSHNDASPDRTWLNDFPTWDTIIFTPHGDADGVWIGAVNDVNESLPHNTCNDLDANGACQDDLYWTDTFEQDDFICCYRDIIDAVGYADDKGVSNGGATIGGSRGVTPSAPENYGTMSFTWPGNGCVEAGDAQVMRVRRYPPFKLSKGSSRG